MSRGRGARSASLGAALLAGSAMLTGCAPTACPAIGWISTLEVTLAEPRGGLQLVLCGDDCVPGEDEAVEGSMAGDSETGWSVDVIGAAETAAYRLTDEAGVVVAEGRVSLEWVRVGGTAQCGGPAEAVIELEIAS